MNLQSHVPCEFVCPELKSLGDELVINTSLVFATCQSGCEFSVDFGHSWAHAQALQRLEILLNLLLVHLLSLSHVDSDHGNAEQDTETEGGETDDASESG